VMPLGLLALLHLVNPQYLAPYATVGGELLLGGLIALIVLGYAWMVRILRLPEPDLLPLASNTGQSTPSRSSRRAAPPADLADRAPYALSSGRYEGQEP
jgi:hypothetical protein